MASKYELRDALRAGGIYPTVEVFLDETYGLPTRDWLVDRFMPTFLPNFLEPFRAQHHKGNDGWDCDDLAMSCVTYARLLNRTNGSGIAIGFLGYEDPELGPHAIVLMFSRNRINGIDIQFYDPTRNCELNLTPKTRLAIDTLII
jgi:hypothetical protein